MWKLSFLTLALLLPILWAEQTPVRAQSRKAKAILEETAQAMSGLKALRALKNQVIESEGQQFEPEQATRPGGQPRHVANFRYVLTRDLTKPSLRLQWEGKTFYPREAPLRYTEVIDGEVGLLEEATAGSSKQTPLHLGRLMSRLREERRTAARIILTAMEQTSLKRLPDTRLDGKQHRVLSFRHRGEEFHLYADAQTKLPSQVEILEDDTVYGDSRYTLRYADWRRVDGVMVPFSLRYEINGILLQSERILSARHNVALQPETLSIPEAVRRQKLEGKPPPSQWLMRRLAMNVSYLDFGRNPRVELVNLAPGVVHAKGTSHNSVMVEMRDYLVVIEAPLYEERSEKVLAAIKKHFPNKPIRYVIPTHFHNDHTGGMRAYMAAGATIIAPAISMGHYERMARAPHTLRPDSLEKTQKAVIIEGITGPRVLTDESRRIEIYPFPTAHSDDYQIIYLPREKLLIEADHVSPRQGGQIRPGDLPRQLLEGIERLQLDVEHIVGIHGDVGMLQDLRNAVRGRKP